MTTRARQSILFAITLLAFAGMGAGYAWAF
jgi:hypothetical protein